MRYFEPNFSGIDAINCEHCNEQLAARLVVDPEPVKHSRLLLCADCYEELVEINLTSETSQEKG